MWARLLACASLDRDPPSLEVRVVSGPALELVAADERPGLGVVTVTGPDGAPEPVLPGRVALDRWPEGVHALTVTAVDRAWWRNRAEARVEVTVDRTAPTLRLLATPAAQGRTVAVWVAADEPLADARVTFFDREHPTYGVGDRRRALVGVAIRAEPGPTPLRAVAHDLHGNEASATLEVPVLATAFEEGGYIRLSRAQRLAREDDEGRAKMRAERDQAYAFDLPEQRWTGRMRWPVDRPKITSAFGKFRRYSTGDRSHHTGLDLGGRTGTPVVSSADGRVLVAWEQAILGNVVIVHHGQGVSTSYNHLDTIAVEADQEVRAGDRLGTMGATGQATGPHLHWGLIVGLEAVDPAQWVEEEVAAP